MAPESGASAAEAQLAARIEAASRDSAARDFDGRSWFWMIVLGALLPLALIVAGWLHVAGRPG